MVLQCDLEKKMFETLSIKLHYNSTITCIDSLFYISKELFIIIK